MSTQVSGAGRHRTSAALVALVLAVVVFALAKQASSILSTGTRSKINPVPVQVSLSARELRQLSKGVHLPAGCRVKYGCEYQGRATNMTPRVSHIPDGCRVKFGCEHEGSTTARP